MPVFNTRKILTNPRGNFTFNITVNFDQIDEPTLDSGLYCPRVNSYPYPSFRVATTPYINQAWPTKIKQQTDIHEWIQRTAVGVDIFCWNGTNGKPYQAVDYEADGNSAVVVTTAGVNNDQTKTQIQYTRPGTYDIEIWIRDECGADVGISGGGKRDLTDPYILPFALGPGLGTVRIRGSFLGAPDRAIFTINGTEVLDTRYRGSLWSGGSTPEFYQSLISAVYVSPPPEGLSYSDAAALTASEVFPCTDCGKPLGVYDSRLGEFDLTFEKTTTDRVMIMTMYNPIATDWSLKVYCPVIVADLPTPLFGYDFKSVRDTTATSVPPIVHHPNLVVTHMAKSNILSNRVDSIAVWRSWGSDGWVINQSMHDQQRPSGSNEFYTFSVKNNNASTLSISGCRGPLLGRIDLPHNNGGGPTRAALIYNRTNSSTDWNNSSTGYTIVADFEIDSNEGVVGSTAYQYDPYDCTDDLDTALKNNPITIPSGGTVYFKLVPYMAEDTANGRLSLYDWESLGDATDFAFYGGLL